MLNGYGPVLVACWLCVPLPGSTGQTASGRSHAGQAASVQLNADPPPLRVTTDTREYCNHLLARIELGRKTLPSFPPKVQFLTDEGQRMCAQGQIRRGIARLRRALVLMKDAN